MRYIDVKHVYGKWLYQTPAFRFMICFNPEKIRYLHNRNRHFKAITSDFGLFIWVEKLWFAFYNFWEACTGCVWYLFIYRYLFAQMKFKDGLPLTINAHDSRPCSPFPLLLVLEQQHALRLVGPKYVHMLTICRNKKLKNCIGMLHYIAITCIPVVDVKRSLSRSTANRHEIFRAT